MYPTVPILRLGPTPHSTPLARGPSSSLPGKRAIFYLALLWESADTLARLA
jgi:hypothetical protein